MRPRRRGRSVVLDLFCCGGFGEPLLGLLVCLGLFRVTVGVFEVEGNVEGGGTQAGLLGWRRYSEPGSLQPPAARMPKMSLVWDEESADLPWGAAEG